MNRLVKILAAIGLLGLVASPSRGDFAYGVTLVDNQLISINTTTGVGSLVGPLGPPGGMVSPAGLASVNNQFYTFDATADVIRQINPATGGFVNTYNIGIGPVIGLGGMAFQSSTVGYLTTSIDPGTFMLANDLYRFNIATGMTTLVATGMTDTLEAIAFGPGGVLYGLGKLDGNLYTVNTTTGGLALIGNVGVDSGNPIGSLAFSSTGQLFATIDDTLYTLSTSTGAATPVGPGLSSSVGFYSISGLAVVPSAVPEPSSAVLLALGSAGSGAVMFLRKRSCRPAV